MLKRFISSIVIFTLGSSLAALANSEFHRNKLNHCKVTKSTTNNYEPEQFSPGNNLLRRAGKKPFYAGEKVIIYGRVLDESCVPVSDAKVYLWQMSHDGKYPYQPLRNVINKKNINLNSRSTFTGSGIATTNNQGEFYFVTLMPGTKCKKVELRVKHKDLGELQTSVRLQEKYLLPEYEEVSKALLPALENTVTFMYQIVLPGKTIKRY